MENKKFDLDAFRAQPLPTESEIIANWQGDIDKPVVSILCHMFNQEMYIEDAFRGFLMQKTDFVFEVIAHDDASTDSTSDIIKEYANRYPKIFKPVIQTENQYSKGAKPCLLSSPHAKGDYFALCEGDDFWIDESKLQKQYLALQKHSGVKLCFTTAYGLKNNGKTKKIASYSNEPKVIITSKVVRGGGGFMPTATLFMHKNIVLNMPSWFNDAPVGDYYIQIMGSLNEGALYLPCVTAVYRLNSIGSWTASRNKAISAEKILSDRLSFINTLNQLKCLGVAESDIRYSQSIQTFIASLELLMANYSKESSLMTEESWYLYPKINQRQAVMYYLRNFPSILKVILRLRVLDRQSK